LENKNDAIVLTAIILLPEIISGLKTKSFFKPAISPY